ncbi:glycoside hydrolase family 16 protein [Desarmillaria tabescens]|uniref:Glycoside hydrolase family 16 protein n=1 Tax=Armillaria tabescens TaxID=1929756 RepID=A0AA39KFG2_ARMTA|nr:glycoside hydrolase family 16 protein [Desarmillaria tabescens]KAK0457798.1 glycoside hydrolase family 16 protein [Desarmillaria tabescens]
MYALSLYGLLPVYAYVWAVKASGDFSCKSFYTTFPSGSVSNTGSDSLFKALSPQETYETGDNGLVMYLLKPEGTIKTTGNVNDKLGKGATINSTEVFVHGKVSFEVSAPTVAGVVTAVILVGSDSLDEIDVELLGGDPDHWSTNVFVFLPGETEPMYGKYASTERVSDSGGSIAQKHTYSIDYDPGRIVWSIDDRVVRTLTKEQADERYPTHRVRIQFGIWDASGEEGTSEWARGPIDWSKQHEKIPAHIHSMTLEC